MRIRRRKSRSVTLAVSAISSGERMLSVICFSSTGCGARAKKRSSVGSGSCSVRPYHWTKALKIAQDGGNFQKLPHREDTAFGRMRHDAPAVLYRAETWAAVFDEQRIDRVGLRQGVALLLDRGKRRDGLHLLFGLLAGAQRHRLGDDLIQFQCFLKGKVHE